MVKAAHARALVLSCVLAESRARSTITRPNRWPAPHPASRCHLCEGVGALAGHAVADTVHRRALGGDLQRGGGAVDRGSPPPRRPSAAWTAKPPAMGVDVQHLQPAGQAGGEGPPPMRKSGCRAGRRTSRSSARPTDRQGSGRRSPSTVTGPSIVPAATANSARQALDASRPAAAVRCGTRWRGGPGRARPRLKERVRARRPSWRCSVGGHQLRPRKRSQIKPGRPSASAWTSRLNGRVEQPVARSRARAKPSGENSHWTSIGSSGSRVRHAGPRIKRVAVQAGRWPNEAVAGFQPHEAARRGRARLGYP